MASSATATAFLPGQLATKMPRRDAAARSMVLTPAPARTMSVSASAAAMAAAVTSVERTTRIATPREGAWADRWRPSSGLYSTVSPSARRATEVGLGLNLSATRSFMAANLTPTRPGEKTSSSLSARPATCARSG